MIISVHFLYKFCNTCMYVENSDILRPEKLQLKRNTLEYILFTQAISVGKYEAFGCISY